MAGKFPFVLLAGCLAITTACAGPPEQVSTQEPKEQEVIKLVDGYGYAGVFKFCDNQGRAVYFSDTAHGGGLVVIDKAPECKKE